MFLSDYYVIHIKLLATYFRTAYFGYLSFKPALLLETRALFNSNFNPM